MAKWRSHPEFHTAFDHPKVRELQSKLARHPDVGPRRAGQFVERMVLGLLHQAGDVHAAELARRLDQLFETRGKLSDAFDAVLNGEKVSAETVRTLFHDMDGHIAALLESPAERLKKQGGPQLPAGLPVHVPLVRSGALRVALGDLMPHFEKLPAAVQDAVGFAAERYPEQLRKVIRAETVEGFLREISELDKLLAKEGMDFDAFRRLNDGIESLQRGALAKREVFNAMARWMRAHDLPEPLRTEVRSDPRLLDFVHSPQMLQDLFAAFHREARGYPFFNYVEILQRHARGKLGEIEASFRLGDDFYVLKGPEGSVTTAGTDLIVVDMRTGDVHIIDNKAFATREQVDAVSALTRNLPKNLADDIAALTGTLGGRPDVPIAVQAALQRLEKAQAELASKGIPSTAKATQAQQPTINQTLSDHRIHREVTGAAGVVDRVSAALQAIGIRLRNVN